MNDRAGVRGEQGATTEDGVVEMRGHDQRPRKSFGHGVFGQDTMRLKTQNADLIPGTLSHGLTSA